MKKKKAKREPQKGVSKMDDQAGIIIDITKSPRYHLFDNKGKEMKLTPEAQEAFYLSKRMEMIHKKDKDRLQGKLARPNKGKRPLTDQQMKFNEWYNDPKRKGLSYTKDYQTWCNRQGVADKLIYTENSFSRALKLKKSVTQ